MSLSTLKNKISKLSQNPGVYIFKSKNGDIIYIGKATNLQSRVRSYFRERGGTNRPIEAMIHDVVDIKTIQTDSVLEALILESNLIKQHQPKYNVKEKDDKSFSYFVITKEKFPRVIILRETELSDKSVIASEAKQSRLENHKIRLPRRYAPRNDSVNTGRVFGPYTSKKQMEIALKIIRKIFPFHSGKLQTEKGCLDFQLGRCPGPYSGAISAEDYKKNIKGIRMILEGKKKNLVKKMEKEMKELSKKHEYEKAAEIRNKVFALKHIQDVALMTQDTLNPLLKSSPWKGEEDKGKTIRMEAYDISNISGQYATGSMIVFENGEPDKAQYRKFKIKTIKGIDDVGMMREVLLRRFKNAWPQPDLIFLDGGVGHANMGAKILKELGFAIPLVAVAKGKSRKNLNFQFSIFNQFSMAKFSNEIKSILDNKNVVKRVMDEAHRFAIRYHKKLRKSNFLWE